MFKQLFIACALLSATQIEAAKPRPKAAIEIPSKNQILEMEKALTQAINRERASHGLPALRTWPLLADTARHHSANMASGKVAFGHDGFHDRADSVSRSHPLRAFAENVAYSYNVPDHLATAVKGWMNSPGHRKNILGSYEETGIGIAFSPEGYCYLTQLFGTRFK